MTIETAASQAIAKAAGSPFEHTASQPLAGGCVNQARQLSDGARSYFVKSNDLAFKRGFELEKLALEEILETKTLRVPKPICVGEHDGEAFLALEFIASGAATPDGWETLGRQLAEMHRPNRAYFGWHEDNTIGATPQPNGRSGLWMTFVRDYRLEHQLRIARKKGFDLRGGEKLLDNIYDFFGDYMPYPSLVHGDLWSGNIGFDADGQPFAFDPAAYFGDREVDIAFTEFFGGFDPRFYDAYREAMPLDSGYAQRKDLYNLYHCLNHFNLFGGNYAAQAQEMADRLLAAIGK